MALSGWNHFVSIEDSCTHALHLLQLRGAVSYHTGSNEFLVSGLSSITKLRYCIKILSGGLVQSTSVEEYGREFRRFVIETARGFLSDDRPKGAYGHLSVEEALGSHSRSWWRHTLAAESDSLVELAPENSEC